MCVALSAHLTALGIHEQPRKSKNISYKKLDFAKTNWNQTKRRKKYLSNLKRTTAGHNGNPAVKLQHKLPGANLLDILKTN